MTRPSRRTTSQRWIRRSSLRASPSGVATIAMMAFALGCGGTGGGSGDDDDASGDAAAGGDAAPAPDARPACDGAVCFYWLADPDPPTSRGDGRTEWGYDGCNAG